ncbi:hypothetical protein TNIN_153781 [Trichonephila inaurata madagascariensis]|uniref:Uncharacterized protein n=1 Tax=Trichonephila inaurata madagascariensis TaxID=2747483 RepID=A0A8X6WN63_9ARAC|nr:hypothetical protein TNIN_153781 [Trichonephila inaurata madagascariensis]
MDITPEILDSMLEKMSNQATESKIAKSITSGIKSFVQTRSDIEGVEPVLCTQKKKKQKINFDPDAFADAVNAILGMLKNTFINTILYLYLATSS